MTAGVLNGKMIKEAVGNHIWEDILYEKCK
jgi:hypothetical protein